MKINKNIKQRNNSIQGLRSFKDALPTKVKRIIINKGDIYSKTLDNWKYLVGDKLFKVCYPKSFKKSNIRGKCLNIMVQHGHEVDLEYSKKIIIDKINYFFGYNVLDSVKINTFENEFDENTQKKINNATKSKFNNKISSIKNSSIKKSMYNFSKVFKAK